MANKHILRIHDTQANLLATLKDKQIGWATDTEEAIWRNGTNFHFLGSGKYWDGVKLQFDNVDLGQISLFDTNTDSILGQVLTAGGTLDFSFAGVPINFTANSIDLTGVPTTADDPTAAQEVATKNYVDTQSSSYTEGDGIDITGNVISVNKDQGLQFNQTTSALKLGPHYLSMASSGVYSGGVLSVSAPVDGNVNISALEGFVIDTSTFGIDSIVTTPVSTNAIVHPISAGSLLNNVTYILITSAGAVLESPTFPTPEERRDNIFLGVAVHPDNVNVQFVNNLQDVSSDITGQLHDLSRRLGYFNITGNGISANGANLSINKAVGEAFKTGVNFENNPKDPDTNYLAAKTLSPLRYRTQTGVEDASSTTVLRPASYDNAGTETAISPISNKATIQRVYVFPSNEIRIQFGQTIYSSFSDAVDAVGKESFVTDTNIKENALLLCQIVLRADATDLSDPSQAQFFQAGRFGEVGSVGSALTGTLQNAYDNSIDPEIITDTTRGALTLKRGSAADTDCVVEVQNGAGTQTFCVDGEGDIIANSATLNGVNAIQDLQSVLTEGNTATTQITLDGVRFLADNIANGSSGFRLDNINSVAVISLLPSVNSHGYIRVATDGGVEEVAVTADDSIHNANIYCKGNIKINDDFRGIIGTGNRVFVSAGADGNTGANLQMDNLQTAGFPNLLARIRNGTSSITQWWTDQFKCFKKMNFSAVTNSSPADGDVWLDSSDGKLKFRENGVTYNFN